VGGKRERGGLVFRKIDHLKKRTQEKKNYATQKLQIYFKKVKISSKKNDSRFNIVVLKKTQFSQEKFKYKRYFLQV